MGERKQDETRCLFFNKMHKQIMLMSLSLFLSFFPSSSSDQNMTKRGLIFVFFCKSEQPTKNSSRKSDIRTVLTRTNVSCFYQDTIYKKLNSQTTIKCKKFRHPQHVFHLSLISLVCFVSLLNVHEGARCKLP